MTKELTASHAIEIEVFKHLFAAIAEEMGVCLMRSAYSPNIKERRDFSCALFDASCQMIAQAAHIPVHLGSTPMSVQAALKHFFPDEMKSEDRFVLNDPYDGGTHLPDITVIAPCILPGESRPRFYVVNRAHHADVGGKTAGSLPISDHIDDEGVLIKPQKLTRETIDWICSHSRTPDERYGDLQAQNAALEVGIKRLQGLCEQYTPEKVSAYAGYVQDYTERMVRHLLGSLPDGKYTFEDVLDDDGLGNESIKIHCIIDISGDEACVDFTQSDEQVTGPVNAVRAIAVSAVHYVFTCLTTVEIPSNAGVMRPIQVKTRSGSIVDAVYPAPVVGGNVETSQRIVDILFGALAKAIPERIPAASCGSMNNVAMGGMDPRFQTPFAYYETIAGGAGATPFGQGGSAVHTHMTNTLNTPVEALEHAYPMQIGTYRICELSGGKGVYSGGNGLVRSYVFTTPTQVTLLTERRHSRPYGLAGGEAGQPGKNILVGVDGKRKELPGKINLEVQAGECLEMTTPGGGGWGKENV